MEDKNVQVDEKHIQPPEFLSYNIAGLEPTSCKFVITIDKLCDMIAKIIRDQIDTLEKVCVENVRETGEVCVYAWFGPKHFKDDSMRGIFNESLARISPEFTKFAERFGYVDEKSGGKVKLKSPVVCGRNRNKDYRGGEVYYLRLNLNAFLLMIFDRDASKYKKEFPDGKPRHCRLKRTWIHKAGSSGKYHNVIALEVEKYANLNLDPGRPMASVASKIK